MEQSLLNNIFCQFRLLIYFDIVGVDDNIKTNNTQWTDEWTTLDIRRWFHKYFPQFNQHLFNLKWRLLLQIMLDKLPPCIALSIIIIKRLLKKPDGAASHSYAVGFEPTTVWSSVKWHT